MKLLKKIKQKLKKYFCKETDIPKQMPKPMKYEPVDIIAEAVLFEPENRIFTREQIAKMYQEELALKIANELLKSNSVEYLVKDDIINLHQKKIYARIKVLIKKNNKR